METIREFSAVKSLPRLQPLQGLFVFFLLLATACSTTPKTPDVQTDVPVGTSAPDTEVGPQPPPPDYGPQLPKDKGLLLVMGPGMVRSFYYAGILRGLRDARLRLSGLIGVEAGALVAAVFATSNTINEFEWKMMKIKDGSLPKPGGTVGKWFGNSKSATKLQSQMEAIFGAARIEDTKIPLKIAVLDEKTGEVRFPSSGKVSDLVAASLAVTGMTDSVDFDGSPTRAPIPERIFPVDEAKAFGPGSIVAVSVIGFPVQVETSEEPYLELLNQGRRNADAEMKRADLLWVADLRGVPFFKTDQRRALEGRGRDDVKRRLGDLRKILEEPPSAEGGT